MAKKRRRKAADLFGGRKAYRNKEPIVDNNEPIIEEVEEGATTEGQQTREELLKELGILNLSIDTVAVILFATFLNFYYVNSLKAQVLDELYNTNFEGNFIDTTDFPKIINTLFLYGTGVFLTLNYTLLQEIKCDNINDMNNKEVLVAWRSFLASLFTFLAVITSRNNLEL
ncbi:hypothetical protein [Clostridium nigeriense]|uniref:hypothetical protein n=1 Tax=Clostridium nigeriense TaxID=1805470 RepID=UPI0008365583|nr:hypothetical protein [Clostridium nigeriense]